VGPDGVVAAEVPRIPAVSIHTGDAMSKTPDRPPIMGFLMSFFALLAVATALAALSDHVDAQAGSPATVSTDLHAQAAIPSGQR